MYKASMGPTFLFIILAMLAACADEQGASDPPTGVNNDPVLEPDMGEDLDPGVDAPPLLPEYTYSWHRDVRPMVESKCATCHYDGGIGPSNLTNFEEVEPFANIMLGYIESEQMPPWPPSRDCNEFLDDRSLSLEQIEMFRVWVEEGTPEGNPDDYLEPEMPSHAHLGEPDEVLDIGFDYMPRPVNGIDDYHCFVMPLENAEEVFLNAWEVVAGNPAMVHHVLFWAFPSTQSNLDRIASLEEADPDIPGYRCFGGNRVDDIRGMLGGWAPGAGPFVFPEGIGFRIPQNAIVIAQIHYNTLNGLGTDRTQIKLHYTEGQPSQVVSMFPAPDTGLYIPAGATDVEAGLAIPLPIHTTLYGVFPHMHLLGTRIKVSGSRNNQETCYIDIPRWDFAWQGGYLFKEPMAVRSGTEMRLQCWYDNSPENQPEGRDAPQDVYWGAGTYDEMCLNYFIIDELPLDF